MAPTALLVSRIESANPVINFKAFMTKHPEDVVYEKIGGYSCRKGKKLLPNGELSAEGEKFYFGKDITKEEALRRKKLVWIEWDKLKAQGFNHWTDDAYRELENLGVIRERNRDASAVTAANFYKEPLSDPELKPYLDDNGMVKKEHAVEVLKIDLLNGISDAEFRSKLHREFRALGKKSAIQALQTIKGLFPSLFEQIVPQFLFNVNGTMAVNPIAADASEGGKGDKAIVDLINEDGGAAVEDDPADSDS